MNNQNPLSQKSVISFKSQVPQMTFQTEPIRNGDRKTSFKVVDFDGEHDVEAALIALDELINAREYLNTNNHGQPDLTVALIYVTALRLVQGRYGRTWGQRLNSVPPGARTIQRLRNELAELIDDVSGQTNARHGLLEYLERKLKFFEDRGLPSEYIARYKELIDYAERLNGTIPPPNDAMAKTWCIKSLSTDLQIYLDEQGGTDGINHYTDDPNFDFSDLGKLCNKKQRYLNANKKKGDNKNKRGRNDGNEESSGQGGSRKKAKKVHFFIDRQGQGPGQGNNKNKSKGGGGSNKQFNACTLPRCVEAANRKGFAKPNHTQEECHFQNGQYSRERFSHSQGRGGGNHHRGRGYHGRGGGRGFQGRGGGFQGRGGGHQGYANEGHGNDSYVADIVARTVTAMNHNRHPFAHPPQHPPQYDSHHLDASYGRSPFMPPPGYTHPGRGGY